MNIIDLKKAIADAVASGRVPPAPCLLCQRPTQGIGLWIVDRAVQVGATPQRPGTMRGVTYPMCLRHKKNVKNATKIERILMQRVRSTRPLDLTVSGQRNN